MTDPPPVNGRAAWHAYYSEKRIVHQWMQVDLLKNLPARRVLEIGPHLGLVTAMLATAGYLVSTLDFEGEEPRHGAERHIKADLRTLDPAVISGFDAILICETLEHIPFDEAAEVLRKLAGAGAPWLILSVPYEGPQLGLSLYLNPFLRPRLRFFRKLHFLRRFPPPKGSAWSHHRWEIGYRDYPVRRLEKTVRAAGFAITRRTFTSGCRSIFLVCRNESVQARA